MGNVLHGMHGRFVRSVRGSCKWNPVLRLYILRVRLQASSRYHLELFRLGLLGRRAVSLDAGARNCRLLGIRFVLCGSRAVEEAILHVSEAWTSYLPYLKSCFVDNYLDQIDGI